MTKEGIAMTNKEQKDKVIEITLEHDPEKRNALIDELSGPEAREMLKMIFRTIRHENTVDFL